MFFTVKNDAWMYPTEKSTCQYQYCQDPSKRPLAVYDFSGATYHPECRNPAWELTDRRNAEFRKRIAEVTSFQSLAREVSSTANEDSAPAQQGNSKCFVTAMAITALVAFAGVYFQLRK